MRFYHWLFCISTLLFLIPTIIYEHWLPTTLMIISFNLGTWVIDLILLNHSKEEERKEKIK